MYGFHSFLRSHLLRTITIGTLIPCMGFSAIPPGWWYDGDVPVIAPNDASDPENNHGVANIGQAKWVAKNALDALREVLPDMADQVEGDLVGAGKPITSWDPPVTQTEKDAQRAPLLIGQLKAISAPFYNRIHAVAPQWLASERAYYEMPDTGTFYPWTATTDDDSNKAPATIGQLKAVFSLDFGADRETGADADDLSDLWEWAVVNASGTDDWTGIGQINRDNAEQARTDTAASAKVPGKPGNKDGDDLKDYEDADPDDVVVNWRKAPESSYVLVDLGLPPEGSSGTTVPWIYSLSEAGDVMASRNRLGDWPGGDGAAGTEYFETYVWRSIEGTWSGALPMPEKLRGVGTAIDGDGNVYGSGFTGLGEDQAGPGITPVSVRWMKNSTGWDSALTDDGGGAGTAFSSRSDTMTGVPGIFNYLSPLFGENGRFVTEGSTASVEVRRAGFPAVLLQRSEESIASNVVLKGEPSGWHVAVWDEETPELIAERSELRRLTPAGLEDVVDIPLGPDARRITNLASIAPELLPIHDGDSMSSPVTTILVWSDDKAAGGKEVRVGSRMGETGELTWTTSKKDAAKRISGKINARGEGLDGTRLWRNAKWHTLTEFIPAGVSGWSGATGLDINSEGCILISAGSGSSRKLGLLLPVSIWDVREHDDAFGGVEDPTDDVQVKDWDGKSQMVDTNVAWILAHRSADDAAPRMPQLVVKVPHLPLTMSLQAKMRINYKRGNSRSAPAGTPPDLVKIPSSGNFETVYNGKWEAWMHYEITDPLSFDPPMPFFGGDAVMTYKVFKSGAQMGGERNIQFRIGGQNPEPQKAKAYIESLPDAGPGGSVWFSYAICKSETADLNGEGSRYNQFYRLPYNRTKVAKPTWNYDDKSTPGGYGMFSVTGNTSSATADIPREQIWNWRKNAVAGVALIGVKRTIANTWMTQQKNANNANGVALPPVTVGTVTFAEGTARTMVDAVTMKAYNGASSAPAGVVDGDGAVPGFIIDPQHGGHYCYWKNGAGWALSRYNAPRGDAKSFNYVKRVCGEVE